MRKTMNPQNVISIDPAGKPEGLDLQKEIFSHRVIRDKSLDAMKRTARALLGLSSHAGDSRRQWSFRVILGIILMCFGVMYMHDNVLAADERVLGVVSVAMILGGALIACGALTRFVSLTLVFVLGAGLGGVHLTDMTGFSMLVCIAVSIVGVITGSGRYSIDTLIYNWFVGRELRKRECHAY